MTVRAVEWKKPYTWGKAIEITEDKVINLKLRAENNLIIYDEWDNEIYVDLQLPDEIRPTDAFPVWITTGRVIVDNWWDYNGTIVCFKTTSGDNIKLYYADDGKLYIDNWTGLFKQIYLKGEVDALLLALRQYVDQQLALKQDLLTAGDYISIDQNNVISAEIPPMSRFLSIWSCSTWQPVSFPATTPFEYVTGDHYLIENVDTTTNYRPSWTEYTWQASTTLETGEVADWDVYIYDGTVWLLQSNHWKTVAFANIAWQPTDNANLATALNAKANASDLNTKTFWLASTSDNDNIVAIGRYSYAGGNPIIIFWNQVYVKDSVSLDTTTYRCSEVDMTPDNLTGLTVVSQKLLNVSYSKTTWPWGYDAEMYGCTTGTDTIGTIGWWSGDVQVSTQANNILTSWMKIWAWTEANYWNLWTYDSNTLYLTV